MLKDYTGQRFGRLLVLARAGASKSGNAMWACRCDCGSEKAVLSTSLRIGDTQSCGCAQREAAARRRTTHGHSVGRTTPTYNSWASMIGRCTNPNYYQYDNYGGRGITVDPRWMDFAAFLADMGERPEDKTLDRIDNAAGYRPGNCRWATPKEQANNRRPRRDSVVHGIHIRES